MPEPKPNGYENMNLTQRARVRWQLVAPPYLKIMGFSALTAILLLAFFEAPLGDWRAALLAGYAWDSTIQKFKVP